MHGDGSDPPEATWWSGGAPRTVPGAVEPPTATAGEALDPTGFFAAAAGALIKALTTEHWHRAQAAIFRVCWEVNPGLATAVGAGLADVRHDVLAARAIGDAATEQGFVAEWQQGLVDLSYAHPTLADELRRALAEDVVPLLPVGDQAWATRNLAVSSRRADLHAQEGRHQFTLMVACRTIGLLLAALGLLVSCRVGGSSSADTAIPGALTSSPGHSSDDVVGAIVLGRRIEVGR